MIGCLVGAALCCVPARAAQSTTADRTHAEESVIDTDLANELAAIDAKSQEVEDLTAEFEQRKYTALLKKPLVSTGTLRIKGSSMRWDTEEPTQSTVTMDQETIQMYYPQQATVEIYSIEQGMSHLAGSPMFRSKMLREHFEIERGSWNVEDVEKPADALVIKLLAKDEKLREHLESVTILIDATSGFVTAAEVHYPDSDGLVLVFKNVRTNSGLKDEDVKLSVPSGTKTIRPLDFGQANRAEPENNNQIEIPAEGAGR